jgi:pyridoxal phosphate enzyme (YggS family)
MHTNLEKLSVVKNKVNEIISEKQLKTSPQIVIVSKKFPLEKITSFIDGGHIHFGENKVQEAIDKWSEIKIVNKDLKLHMLGGLQSNKAKKAVKFFDYIHSLDNTKLALKIYQYEKELNKKVKLFIQVNTGNEDQKSGILLNELDNFFYYCTKKLSLNVIGLMCLPPIGSDPADHFKILKNSAEKLNLNELSMGMSADFEQAISNGSTYLRLGTIILGERPTTI